jgi:TrmH family RNA methyltransferase
VRQDLATWVRENPELPIFATTLSGADSIYHHDFRHGAAFLIGNEGAGLTEADEALASHRVKIPIPGNAESLNAAMAATICLYEAVRQRLSP